MESCKMNTNTMSQRSILLAVVILMTCSIGESGGFFLKNYLSEATTDETQFSGTTPIPATLSADINREIHRNVSEKLKESSTQIVNSVKDIITLVLDEHITANQTQQKLSEENNQIDVDSRTIAFDGDNDIPAPQEALTNLEHVSDDQSISIVKIPEANDKDIVTSLEDKIRNSVKDQQNFEHSAIDVIDGIPELEVRQSLTEDLMAIEYPQSVKKLEDTASIAKEEDEINSTETLLEVTTAATNTSVDPKEDIHNPDDLSEETTINVLETESLIDSEATTPTSEDFQEITLIPTEEIVHTFEDLLDAKSISEEKPLRTRHMRGFSEQLDTNEVSPSEENSKDTQSSKSKSIDSSDPSTSSDSSSKDKSSSEDENVAAEDTSGENDEVISQDASIEESLENGKGNTEQPITTESISSTKVTPTPRPAIASETTVEPKNPESNASAKVTPTPRPAIASVTTVKPIKSDGADPILIEGITESTEQILNDVYPTTGEGKHIVIKKLGVDEGLTSLNTFETRILEEVDAPSGDPVIPEPTLEVSPEIDYVVNHVLNTTAVNIEDVPRIAERTKPSIEIDSHKDNSITENFLLETEDQLVHSESQDSTQTALPINVEPLIGNLPLENDIHTKPEESLTMDTESKSNHTLATEGSIIDQETQHTSSPAPTLQTESNSDIQQPSLIPTDQPDRLRTLDTDHEEPRQILSLENASKTLNAEPVSVPRITLDTEKHISTQTPSEPLMTANEEVLETSTESPSIPSIPNVDVPSTSFSNEISKHVDDPEPSPKDVQEELLEHPIAYETSTEKPSARSNENSSSPALVNTLIEAAELTTEFARQVDSFRTTRIETAAISDEIVSPPAAGRSSNAIIAEGLGKPLPTRSVGDEPSSSSYSSEDKTTTVVVLCSSAAVIFTAFSIAIYLITFQRQHGTLDIEMQEQRCGKDNLEDDEEAETRVTLLNQFPQVDSDEHSSD